MKLATRITQLHSTKKQHFFFLFGAPGVGKGTYAKLLTQDFQLSHISTGDEIRKYLKKTPESNVQINLLREIVRSGGLVNDAIAL
jgi:adenylate kinase